MMNAAIINDMFERHLWHGKVLIIVSEKLRYKTIYNINYMKQMKNKSAKKNNLERNVKMTNFILDCGSMVFNSIPILW